MDNRLIFLYHLPAVISNGGTQKDRVSALLVMRVQAVRCGTRQIPFL